MTSGHRTGIGLSACVDPRLIMAGFRQHAPAFHRAAGRAALHDHKNARCRDARDPADRSEQVRALLAHFCTTLGLQANTDGQQPPLLRHDT